MPARVLHAGDAHWRPSNRMGVQNTDLAKQLGGGPFAARYWRLAPGQASTRHRHMTQTEFYVVLEGRGRMRIEDDPALTLAALVVGTPPELANTLEMTAEQLAPTYPDGPRALPPELTGE